MRWTARVEINSSSLLPAFVGEYELAEREVNGSPLYTKEWRDLNGHCRTHYLYRTSSTGRWALTDYERAIAVDRGYAFTNFPADHPLMEGLRWRYWQLGEWRVDADLAVTSPAMVKSIRQQGAVKGDHADKKKKAAKKEVPGRCEIFCAIKGHRVNGSKLGEDDVPDDEGRSPSSHVADRHPPTRTTHQRRSRRAPLSSTTSGPRAQCDVVGAY
jgi:hypothetical protein